MNDANLDINNKEYETGVSFDFDNSINIKVLDWLELSSMFKFNYQTYGALKEDVSETVSDVNLFLGGRSDLYSSQNFRVYLGFGGEYLKNSERMILEGSNAHLTRRTMGPVISLGFDWSHVDLSFSASELFGKRTSSFDRSRNIRLEHLSLKVTPRLWRFGLPADLDYFIWEINDFPKVRQNRLMKLRLRPSVDIKSHISVFGNLGYAWSLEGEELYSTKEFGGGVKVKW